MCQIHNPVGSLTSLKNHLAANNINNFKSLNEVIEFRNSYASLRQQIIKDHEILVENEKNTLQNDLEQLDKGIEDQKERTRLVLQVEIEKQQLHLESLAKDRPTNFIIKLFNIILRLYYLLKISHNKIRLHSRVLKSVKELDIVRQHKTNRYHFLLSQFDEAVSLSSLFPLRELEIKKWTIEKVSSYIPGAIGENKVVKVLETLSDEYFLINDFSINFSKAIYNKKENDYIKSIQADHVLVAPSGIFLIETKNWSDQSLNNPNLRSPVQQIRRTSFALFRLLNTTVANETLNFDHHHWGKLKIPMKSVIVLTNKIPIEEFQYVKILDLNRLLPYVQYFKPIFSYYETQQIAAYLLKLNGRKTISVK